MPDLPLRVAYATECLLCLVGLVLLWRFVVSARGRAGSRVVALTPWGAEAMEFLLFLLLVSLGFFAFAVVASATLKHFGFTGDLGTVVAGAGAQFGMLAGVLTFASRNPGFRSQPAIGAMGALKSGFTTFAIALPIIFGVSKLWDVLLTSCGLPPERQDLIRMFLEAKSPPLIVALSTLAIFVAPVTEELVFRAGAFRFARARLPRWSAILLPAVIFAALHVNWRTLEGFASFAPLVALAAIFSIAYERTGNVSTSIVAHALFNLNTILMIFCGVTT
jgi:membrane protease YdiL (CAAX protease family)